MKNKQTKNKPKKPTQTKQAEMISLRPGYRSAPEFCKLYEKRKTFEKENKRSFSAG